MQLDGNFSLGILFSLIALGLFLARARKTLLNALVTGIAILVILLLSMHWGMLSHLQFFVGGGTASAHPVAAQTPHLKSTVHHILLTAQHVSLKKAPVAPPTYNPLALIFLASIALAVLSLTILKFLRDRRRFQDPMVGQLWTPCAKCGEEGYHMNYYTDYSVDTGEEPQKLCFECAQTLRAIAL